MQTKIALYSANTTSFNNVGLGILADTPSAKVVEEDQKNWNINNVGLGILADTLSAKVVEEAQTNGNIKYELTLEHPLNSKLANDLRESNLVRVPLSEKANDFEVFELYDYLDDDVAGTITVYGQAIGYRVLQMPFDNGGQITKTGTVQQILSYAQTLVRDWPDWFNLKSDISQVITMDTDFENVGKFIEHLLVLTDAQIEHRWNELWIKKRGSHLKTVLRDDKNTDGLTVKYDRSNILNKIIPVYEDGTKGRPLISEAPFKYFNYWRGKTIKFKDQSETIGYFEKTKVDQPKLTAEVKTVLIDDELSDVKLFDYLTIYNKRMSFYGELQVISRTLDGLTAKVTDLKLGTVEKDLTTSNAETIANVNDSLSDMQGSLDEANARTDEKLEEQNSEFKQKVIDLTQDLFNIDDQSNTRIANAVAEFQQAIEDNAEEMKGKIEDFVSQNSNGPITLYDQSGNFIKGIPPIASLRGEGFELNSSGFNFGGRIIGGDGTLYADGLYAGASITSPIINGGEFNGGEFNGVSFKGSTFDGYNYFRSVGSGGISVMSGDHGYSFGNSHIGADSVNLPTTTINGGLTVHGDLWVDGTINGKEA